MKCNSTTKVLNGILFVMDPGGRRPDFFPVVAGVLIGRLLGGRSALCRGVAGTVLAGASLAGSWSSKGVI